jgi:hypothetical protein
MFVKHQVSSMNTRRDGSRSSWPSNHASRRFRTSGRLCSLACAVFFERDPATVEKPPERRNRDRDAHLRQQGAQFDQRDIALSGDSVENEIGIGLDLVRMPVSTLRPGPRIALLCVKGAIANSARRADAEPLDRLASRHAARNGGNNAFTKVKRQRLHHARQPPSPPRILNQNEED